MVHPKVASWECPDCSERIVGVGMDYVAQLAKSHYAVSHPINKPYHYVQAGLRRKLRALVQEPG